MNKERSRRGLAVLLCLALLGCAPGYANPDGTVSYTAHNWLLWKLGMDSVIADEKAGRSAPGAISWEKYWLGTQFYLSQRLQSGGYVTEHAELYIKYIVDQRRAAGLPDIAFYPKDP